MNPAVKGDPFLFADWERVVFLHFVIDPDLVRPHVPSPLTLELYQGKACISLAAITMRSFRPCERCSTGWLFRPITEQRFLNLRTYVRCGDEPGVLFIRGWLSQPFGLGLPSGMFRLPYTFASLDYSHHFETGKIQGQVTARALPRGLTHGQLLAGVGTARPQVAPVPEACCGDEPSPPLPIVRLAYSAAVDPKASFHPCEPGSLAEFAMERCTGFFCRGNDVHVFRAWHPPWSQAPLDVQIEEDNLITSEFPWFSEAKLAAANFAPGFQRVWLGRAHRLQSARRERQSHRPLSTFFEMP